MAKELPYFRFTVSEWMNDDISIESYTIKGVFSDVCAFYWFKDCNLSLAMLEKKFNNAKEELKQLIELGIIKKNDDDSISILFLDKQYDMLSEKRKKRQLAGSKGGLSKSSNAKAKLKQCSSYKDKDKDKEKNKDNLFDLFWEKYSYKKSKDAALKSWGKLNEEEKSLAIKSVPNYLKSLQISKVSQAHASTWLNGKRWEDEYSTAPINYGHKF